MFGSRTRIALFGASLIVLGLLGGTAEYLFWRDWDYWWVIDFPLWAGVIVTGIGVIAVSLLKVDDRS